MKSFEIFEARKNPEQTPKHAINDIVIAATRETDSSVADTKNLFVSFTSVDKLGINPGSEYKTPIGIYAYPAEYVVDTVGEYASIASLPFAGTSPYVNLFNASGNIINIATITAADTRKYYRKIADLWVQLSGKDWKTSVDNVEDYTNDAGSKAKFPDYPGGQLWYVTMQAAEELFSKAWNTTPVVAWNKLFRSIGVDGVVDYTPEGGTGIIHTNEPTQAVFFSVNSIENVKRYDNKYSPALVS